MSPPFGYHYGIILSYLWWVWVEPSARYEIESKWIDEEYQGEYREYFRCEPRPSDVANVGPVCNKKGKGNVTYNQYCIKRTDGTTALQRQTARGKQRSTRNLCRAARRAPSAVCYWLR